jgi:Complex I intermediate-associated protein 30 (CIA30)
MATSTGGAMSGSHSLASPAHPLLPRAGSTLWVAWFPGCFPATTALLPWPAGARRSFDTTAGEWQTVTLPFSEFSPVFRARTLRDGSALDPGRVASVQLMLSKFEYDGELNPAFRPGAFRLPIASIRAYAPQARAGWPASVVGGGAGVVQGREGGQRCCG